MNNIGGATLAREGRKENFDRYFYPGCKILSPKPKRPGAKLLDLGCGQGEMSQFFKKIGWVVSAADASRDNVAKMQKLEFPVTRLDLNEQLPYEDASFDMVALVDVIEHVVKAEFLISEINRLLCPDGLLLLSTPNQAFYKRRIRALAGRPPDEEGYHFRFFIRRKLRKLLSINGFSVIQKNSIGYYPFMNELLLRKFRGLQKLRIHIPICFETIFAENFIWLVQKKA